MSAGHPAEQIPDDSVRPARRITGVPAIVLAAVGTSRPRGRPAAKLDALSLRFVAGWYAGPARFRGRGVTGDGTARRIPWHMRVLEAIREAPGPSTESILTERLASFTESIDATS